MQMTELRRVLNRHSPDDAGNCYHCATEVWPCEAAILAEAFIDQHHTVKKRLEDFRNRGLVNDIIADWLMPVREVIGGDVVECTTCKEVAWVDTRGDHCPVNCCCWHS